MKKTFEHLHFYLLSNKKTESDFIVSPFLN